MPSLLDADFLAAALVGYQEKLQEIEAAMADLRTRIGRKAVPTRTVKVAAKRRVISPEGLARIAAAQRKRWAAVRKAAAAKAAPAEAKPRVRKAAPKKIATKKARPLVAPKKQAKVKTRAKVAAKKVVRSASAKKKTVAAKTASAIESISQPPAEAVPPTQ